MNSQRLLLVIGCAGLFFSVMAMADAQVRDTVTTEKCVTWEWLDQNGRPQGECLLTGSRSSSPDGLESMGYAAIGFGIGVVAFVVWAVRS